MFYKSCRMRCVLRAGRVTVKIANAPGADKDVDVQPSSTSVKLRTPRCTAVWNSPGSLTCLVFMEMPVCCRAWCIILMHEPMRMAR